MSKEQFFVRVHTLYNAGGTIWPLEVEFTHTVGEPPTLVERLNGLSKAGFIPANQVAVSPPHTGNGPDVTPHCPVHNQPMKYSQRQPKDGSKAYYCATLVGERDGYCNRRATVSQNGDTNHHEARK